MLRRCEAGRVQVGMDRYMLHQQGEQHGAFGGGQLYVQLVRRRGGMLRGHESLLGLPLLHASQNSVQQGFWSPGEQESSL